MSIKCRLISRWNQITFFEISMLWINVFFSKSRNNEICFVLRICDCWNALILPRWKNKIDWKNINWTFMCFCERKLWKNCRSNINQTEFLWAAFVERQEKHKQTRFFMGNETKQRKTHSLYVCAVMLVFNQCFNGGNDKHRLLFYVFEPDLHRSQLIKFLHTVYFDVFCNVQCYPFPFAWVAD